LVNRQTFGKISVESEVLNIGKGNIRAKGVKKMNAIDILVGKSFDNTKPNLKTEVKEVSYTALLSAPDERVISETVKKYMRAG
jgi:hypothetical protein